MLETGQILLKIWTNGGFLKSQLFIIIIIIIIIIILSLCLFIPMPTHCTITRFGFRARRIDDVECGLFSNHAPLGQTTLHVGRVSV